MSPRKPVVKKKRAAVKLIEVCIMSGVEGPSVYINGIRIMGPKPWGGGKVIADECVEPARIRAAIRGSNIYVRHARGGR